MTRPVVAIIVCVGAATRMRPLSQSCPKSLITFCGRPLLEFAINNLNDSGISEIIVVAGLEGDEFDQYVATREPAKMKIQVVRHGTEHGSGGVLKVVIDSLTAKYARFLVVYGDSLLKMDFASILSFHESRKHAGCLATVVCHSPEDLTVPGQLNSNYGVLWLAPDGRCTKLVEKPPVLGLSSNFASAAVFVLERSIFKHMTDVRPTDLTTGLLARLASGSSSPVFGFRLEDGYRYDIGTIAEYRRRQFEVLDGEIEAGNIKPTGQLFGRDVSVGTTTRLLGHNILGDNVVVGEDCVFSECVILAGSIIGNHVTMNGVILGRNCRVSDHTVLRPQTVLGDWSVVG